jgi:putative SOS response-associated peptidase YedK
MPVILTEPGEWDLWLNSPIAAAQQLQRPLPDGALLPLDTADESGRLI